LLACLGEALHEWDGRRATPVTLTSHGRHALLAGLDLSRTVGWFQADYPFRLDRLSTEHEIEAALEAVPSQGVGWGVLRWLSSTPPAHDEPDIAVNYLGAVDLTEDGDFELSELLPSALTRGFRRTRSIEVEAFTNAGCLHLAIRYAPRILSSAAIHALKDTMVRCLQARADSYLGSPGQYTEITQSILGSTHVS
jgi:non-ribosomal peptide synthase protein (TIGR01720 family)